MPAALLIGVGSLVLILVFQRLLPRVPGVLVAVVLAILAVNVFDLTDRGVKVVGPLPEGFPPFTIPTVPLGDLALLFAGALGIALVSLTDTISTASAFAARSGDQVDGDKEMIGIGAANIAAGFFQGFPVSTSGSRTAVAAQNGAKTQVTGLVGAGGDPAAAAVRARSAAEPAATHAGRGGDRGVDVAGRPGRDAPAVAAAQVRLRAGDGGFPRGRAARGAARHRAGGGAVDPGCVQPGVAAVRGRTRPGGRHAGYHDTTGPPERRAPARPGDLPVRQPAVLRQCQHLPGHGACGWPAPTPGPTWILVAAEPITDIDTTAADMLEDLDLTAERRRHQPGLRRDEDPGTAEGRTVRADRA